MSMSDSKTSDYDDAAKLAQFVGLEGDVFPEWGLTVLGYMDGEGTARFVTNLIGEHSATTLIGVLEVVKHELLMIAMNDSEDESEE